MNWEPPPDVSNEIIAAASARAEAAGTQDDCSAEEYVFRIEVAGLPWDIAGAVYEPRSGEIPIGPDGRKVGAFLIHGGGGDHRGFNTMARLLARMHSMRVVTISYPGNVYLKNDTHDWPGDTLNADGTVRTPMWAADEQIGPDQYEVVQDNHDPIFRAKYGTLFFARAHEGTRFYDRLAAWPWAYEQAFQEACRRFLPDPEYSIYASGVSTGGPFAHLCLQRIPNIVGLVGAESSPFGAIFSKMLNQGWPYEFNMMTVRTWRDVARYAGPEAGAEGARRLPWLMEEVFERHAAMLHTPLMKVQHLVQFAAVDQLRAAAQATGKRLGMNDEETAALADRFAGYPFPMQGDDVKPVPPLLYTIMANSRDHTYERYSGQLLPELAKLSPAPKARIVRFAQGIHQYQRSQPGLPWGNAPAVAELWNEAIMKGYYLP
jgi:hypothetical protein